MNESKDAGEKSGKAPPSKQKVIEFIEMTPEEQALSNDPNSFNRSSLMPRSPPEISSEGGSTPKAASTRTPPKETEEVDETRTRDKRPREDTPTKGEDAERMKRGKSGEVAGRKKSDKEDEDDEEETSRKIAVEQAAAKEARRKDLEDFDKKVAAEQERVRQEKQRQEEKRKLELGAKKGEELTDKIRREVKRINKAVTREVAGKISFRREDQLSVLEGTRNILDIVIELVHRLNDVEAIPHGEDGTSNDVNMTDFKKDIARLLTVNNDLLKGMTEEMNRQREENRKWGERATANFEQKIEELQKKIESGKQQRQYREAKNTGRGGRVGSTDETAGDARDYRNETDDIRTTTDIGHTDSNTADDSDTEEYDRQKRGQRRIKKQNRNIQADRTYAQKVKGWRTPESKPVLESFVRLKDCTESGAVLKELAKVKAAELGGPPLRVNKLKSGAVVMQWRDTTHRDKAMKRVGEMENMEVRNAKINYPMFLITGVSSEYDGDQLIKGILEQNEDLREAFENRQDEIKIITKVTCRNPWKQNWLFQAKPDIFKALVKKGKVNFNLELLHVEEHFGVALCFRCHRFGHVAKYCREDPACGKCAGAHDTKECQNEGTECINCKRMNKTDRGHSARDKSCPVYKWKTEQSKKKTVYGV